MEKKKLLIVDDHRIFAESLSNMLGETEQFEIDKSFTINEAITKYKATLFDIIITDIQFPELDGFFFIDYIRKQNDSIKIVALSSFLNPLLLKRLQRMKVNAYLNKNTNRIDLIHILNNLNENHFYYPSYRGKENELSPREIEILKFILEEKTTKDISILLNISISTIETHRRNLFIKTNSLNMIGLAKYAIINNII
ncbi:response regulator transcription factor [Flavobacterium sp.]|uniref:response regulator transcription factor n=1 Tax=Flavobacterium sp. TaxID=239 RepID=UPI004047C5D8